MITPIISEAVWSECFSRLPSWSPPRDRMIVIAPHPDDEVLGVGGLIAAQALLGVEIIVVAVTDGENAYPGDPEDGRLGITRIEEQTRALGRLGVPAGQVKRLRLPDSGVSHHISLLVKALSPLVTEHTHVVAPWQGDFHPDHEACGIAAEVVSKTSGAQLTSYFFWTWHRGTPELIKPLPLRSFPLDATVVRAKEEALSFHQSQLVRKLGDEILPEYLLGPARRPFEIFLVP